MIDTPVIYLTRYYKEKSSFYFTLYHELVHIKRDFNMLKNKVYISEDESKIDKLALIKIKQQKIIKYNSSEYLNNIERIDI